jgi:hypothetical protein
VLALVEILSVDDPEPLSEGGENEAVAPAGKPDAERLTFPPKPPTEVIETVEVAPNPSVAEIDFGEAAIEKSGFGTVGASAGKRLLASNEPTPVTKSYGGPALYAPLLPEETS